MPCAMGAADCSVLDGYNYDGRAVQLKVKDVPSDLPVALLPSERFLADAQSNLVAYASPNIDYPPGPFLPLNVLYCVYLD